jgi:hypothetical protein
MSKGLYAAYFTSAAGTSIGLFCIGDGIIAGADAGGITYDGALQPQPDGTFTGLVNYTVPPDHALITGNSGSSPHNVWLPLDFPQTFADGKTVFRLDTPLGSVSARFVRLRDLS